MKTPNMLRRLSNLVIIFVLVMPFMQVERGSAQSDVSNYIRQVRALESEDTGLMNPAGLAYTPKGNVFHVVEGRGSQTYTNIIQLPSFGRRTSSARVLASIQQPINMAFDSKANRLLIFQTQANQLLEVRETGSGNLAATNIIRYDGRRYGLRDPQGMAVDGKSGALYILDADGPRIVRIEPGGEGSFNTASVTAINIQTRDFATLRGLAYNPMNGRLYVIDTSEQELYELTQSGQVGAVRELSEFGLNNTQGMVFAPSGDQTDDPEQVSLYIADSGLVTQQTPEPKVPPKGRLKIAAYQTGTTADTGQIVELTLVEPPAAAAATYTSTMIKITDMAAMSPPSPDPSGLAYLPFNNRLMMVDGEVEETVAGITHFQGANVWELTFGGGVIRTANVSKIAPTVTRMTNEPTGVAFNTSNGHYYVTDDNGKRVYDLNPGTDGLIGTSDDTWVYFDTSSAGSTDPEGVAFDTWRNRIFVADGVNAEVYEFTTSGVLVNQFDVQQYGVVDPESVEFNPESGTLFVMSSARSSLVVVETTTTGTLLRTIDISVTNARAAAGLAYAPASNGSGVKRFYIVDRGIDNDSDPNIIDGKMYEITAPSSVSSTATPTNTLTNTPTKTNTPTAASTFTPSNTYTPTNTFTSTNTFTPTSTFTPGPSPTNTFTITPTPSPSSYPLFVSFANNGSVGGVSFADEDILRFDGVTWSLFFDGSDVGVGGLDVIAFYLVDADTILISFNKAISFGAWTADPYDVVQFDATSLGSNTAGIFSLYFDGNDVGLDSSTENIDALEILPDGRVLLSTTGNPSIAGMTGLADEDILAFTPITLGDVTSGTWIQYFDGSDVGLADSSNEDINALDVDPNGAIYLSTIGDFSVPGVSGFNEDVFVCSPTSLGSVTACNYSSVLFFDGSTWGQDANDVDALNILESGSFPTATPTNTMAPLNTPSNTPAPTHTSTPSNTPAWTNTPVNTPTVTSTAVPTQTNTPTLGPSPTPTNTPTHTPTATATFTPSNTPMSTATISSSPTSTSDVIFVDGFESGDFSAWSANKNSGIKLSVTASSALVGSNGMQVVVNDTTALYVTDDLPNAETRYRVRFYFDPNSIAMAEGESFYIFNGYNISSVFNIQFGFLSGSYQLRLRQQKDSTGTTSTAWVVIDDAPHVIEIEWWAATSDGANNGGATLWIDDVPRSSVTGVDNDTLRIEYVRLGAVTGLMPGTQGTFYLDAFDSRRESYIGP